MIPYIPQPKVSIGPLEYHLFGLLVTIGVLLGAVLVLYRSHRLGIGKEIREVLGWVIAIGFLCCIVMTTVFYFPERIAEHGISALFDPHVGMSSYGGFIGGFATAWIYFKIKRIPCGRHIDVLIQGLVIGWVFGRLGCTFAHDHIGAPSNFFLAFAYPEGSRHNLGFYEFLFTIFVLLPITLAWNNEKQPPLQYTLAILLIYGTFRFGTDFLRAYDLRHFGLTFAQWCSLGALIFGVIGTIKSTKRPNRPSSIAPNSKS